MPGPCNARFSITLTSTLPLPLALALPLPLGGWSCEGNSSGGNAATVIRLETMLEAIINSTHDAISVVDDRGIGILINPAYTKLTGLKAEDVLGKPATVDISEGDSAHLEVLRTGKPVKGARMKVGPARKDVIVNAEPIIVDGKICGSVAVVHDVSEIVRLTEELDMVRKRVRHLEATYTFDDIVAVSPTSRSAVEQAMRAADTPATIILRGESGTGKELFAHAIHNYSRRQKGRFVKVNCAALTGTLLESELFGYAEGAFTGAKKGGKAGLFEEANGGTIFLDEVGEMSPALQTKFLRVLQEKEITRVGDTKPIRVDFRVIAATNSNLEQAVAQGLFREDLYYRLSVVPIFIPPLRQRREDIPALVDYLVKKLNQEYGRRVREVAPETVEILSGYNWPGNVRELENVLGRALINMKSGETVVLPEHLPPLEAGPRRSVAAASEEASGRGCAVDPNNVLLLSRRLSEAESLAIREALKAAGGNKTRAARLLGISIRSLHYKIKRLGVFEDVMRT
ncbi:MAG TPA: sigma-54-dependent transcriptional regulator [Clostridia bacterium]|nr:sigma-54-dependent transcriptional regulator [Clostridia bacterium]